MDYKVTVNRPNLTPEERKDVTRRIANILLSIDITKKDASKEEKKPE